ncbi:shikimate dehydrogenase [uncultured Celeribacter sp.]|uniref:shikimate dehydrogenase n=1 Tax=uncultured Celeribacter sp. TaxID=1303376 RepID=UPI002AA759FD|nr:shikimate dehydrogenase [uncultured Celeribacter sp.]
MSASNMFLDQLTGSFSTPAAENPTVAMIEAAYRHHGIAARYINCEVQPEDLREAVRGARAMRWIGFNCSIPHKVAVIEHLDQLTDAARLIGAVNCVAIRDGELIGENTDGKGFLASLQTVTDPVGKKVLVLGAGGAARAIAIELALAGAAHIAIANRNDRGAELAEHIDAKTPACAEFLQWSGDVSVPDGTDIVVNATPVGLYPDVEASPAFDFQSLSASMVVADVIPNPPRTAFLKSAGMRGCQTLDGLGMLVNQGIAGIAFWTGMQVEAAPMRAALSDIFAV